MGAAENADRIRAGYKVFNTGDVPGLIDLFAEDIVWHFPGNSKLAGEHVGRDATLGVLGAYGEAAGGTLQANMIDVMANGEKAAVRWHAKGSFTGPVRFEGMIANGAAIDVQGCDVLTIREGRIHRNDAYMNGADMARQLGALPPAGSAAERAATGALNLKTRLRAWVAARRG